MLPLQRASNQLQVSNSDAESLYRFIAQHQQGVTQEVLAQGGWSDETLLLRAAKKLLAEGRLSVTEVAERGGRKGVLYQAVDPHTAAKFRGLEKEHMLVYQMIDRVGDKGTFGKAIRDETGFQNHTLTRVIKDLLRRQLIKEVKSVQGRGRKVYMKWDVEPDKSVTGGSFYQDGEFATAWIESLRWHCLQHLAENSSVPVTLDDLHFYVQQQPGPSPPTPDDIRHIMRSLELEEEILAMQTTKGVAYCLRRRQPGASSLFDVLGPRLPKFIIQDPQAQPGPQNPQAMPCFICPVAHECRPNGIVSPERCEYLAAWLQTGRKDGADDGRGGPDLMTDW